MLAEVAKLALADDELDVASAHSTRFLELAVHIGNRDRTLLERGRQQGKSLTLQDAIDEALGQIRRPRG